MWSTCARRYTTNYGAMVAKSALTGGGAAAGAPRTRRSPPEPRPWRAPRANPPRQTEVSRSTLDYGPRSGDPMDHMAGTEKMMTKMATTKDLAAGTERNTWNIPGYTGFQCATTHNKLAVEHSMGTEPRCDGKVSLPTVLEPHLWALWACKRRHTDIYMDIPLQAPSMIDLWVNQHGMLLP